MAMSSVTEITGKSRISSIRIAVNCNCRDGRRPSGLHVRVRHACADHVVISDSPRTNHTQLRRISTPLAIVIEAGLQASLESLKKL